jgi:hypothetical protein
VTREEYDELTRTVAAVPPSLLRYRDTGGDRQVHRRHHRGDRCVSEVRLHAMVGNADHRGAGSPETKRMQEKATTPPPETTEG